MLGAQRFVAVRVSVLGHVRATEIELGCQCVVGSTVEGHIRGRMVSVLAEWTPVVQLEPARLAAAFTALVDKAAAPIVALENDPPDLSRNMSTARTRRRRRQLYPPRQPLLL